MVLARFSAIYCVGFIVCKSFYNVSIKLKQRIKFNRMQLKQHQTALLIHRPRKRRQLVSDPKNQQKSQNLKSLHQTLFCQQPQRKISVIPQRTSVASLLNHYSRNLSKKKGSQNSKEKEKSNNFYINIQKLRNFKIQSKEYNHKRVESSQQVLNPYLKRDKLSHQRRSQLLKSYGLNKKSHQNISHQQLNNNQSIHRLSKQKEKQTNKNKGRIRYKTETDESIIKPQELFQSNKKTFKRAHNEIIFKDKNFIQGYLRGKQLGRGGFSKVWEGFNFKTKTFYAVKQIDTKNKYQTHLTEIWFGNYFFENGSPKKQYLNHQGIKSLLKMFTYSIVDPRAFIVYESCNGSLGSMLYDIYEQDAEEELKEDDRFYMIKYKPLYNELRKNTSFLKTLIYQMAQALDLLSQHKIVHSDIKTENILINIHETYPKFQFKLIDYGSTFVFQNLKQYKLATPEYMSPELLNFILFENKKAHREDMLPYVKKYQNISAIDVWGLGCILIELIHGLPLWLSNHTKIMVNGRFQMKKGLFAVNDRSFSKILQRQLNLVDNFDLFLAKQNNSGIFLDECLKKIIKAMLIPNPRERIRPQEIIKALEAKEQDINNK